MPVGLALADYWIPPTTHRQRDGWRERFGSGLKDSSADISAVQFCPSGQSCPRTTAEVIAEDPDGGPPGHQLADFHEMSFAGITVTSQDGTHGTLEGNSLWSASQVTMKYDSTVLAQPGPRIDGSTAFDDTWQAGG
jgi:peptidase A4-like protein